jgi:ABC-2 type transport system ATP-binding protein
MGHDQLFLTHQDLLSAHVGRLALTQHRPLYHHVKVHELMRAGAAMNHRWLSKGTNEGFVLLAGVDQDATLHPVRRRANPVAIALAPGRLPRLLLLDEPLSDWTHWP